MTAQTRIASASNRGSLVQSYSPALPLADFRKAEHQRLPSPDGGDAAFAQPIMQQRAFFVNGFMAVPVNL